MVALLKRSARTIHWQTCNYRTERRQSVSVGYERLSLPTRVKAMLLLYRGIMFPNTRRLALLKAPWSRKMLTADSLTGNRRKMPRSRTRKILLSQSKARQAKARKEAETKVQKLVQKQSVRSRRRGSRRRWTIATLPQAEGEALATEGETQA